MRLVLLVALLALLAPFASAQDEPARPLEVKVVALDAGSSASWPLLLPENASRAFLLVVGGLTEGERVDAALRSDAGVESSWTWSNASEERQVERVAISRGASNLSLDLSNPGATPARVYVYHDAPCLCNKTLPFPGALAVLNVTLAKGDAAALVLDATPGLRVAAEAQTLDGAPLAARQEGAVNLTWRAPVDGDAFVFVEAMEGVGDVEPRFTRTPAPRETPMGWTLLPASWLLAGLVRAGCLRREPRGQAQGR